LGVALFILAILAKECGFEDWVEVPNGGREDKKIQLAESDEEDGHLVGAGGVSRM